MKAMIMAAGRGERMRPLTDRHPKPLLKVRGKALLDYHIHALVAAGFNEIVVNAAWLAEQIIDHVGTGERFGCRIQVSHETEALESGGGIVKALPLLGDEPFLVVNGDTFCDFDYRHLQGFELGDHLAHLVLVNNPEHNLKGDFSLRNGLVSNTPEHTFSGIRIVSPALFDGCAVSFFSMVPRLREAVERGRVSGEHYEGVWHDIGTPERLAAINHEH